VNYDYLTLSPTHTESWSRWTSVTHPLVWPSCRVAQKVCHYPESTLHRIKTRQWSYRFFIYFIRSFSQRMQNIQAKYKQRKTI